MGNQPGRVTACVQHILVLKYIFKFVPSPTGYPILCDFTVSRVFNSPSPSNAKRLGSAIRPQDTKERKQKQIDSTRPHGRTNHRV